MKVYKIEFTYFDGVSWDYKYVEITALNKIQLMKAFLKETQYISSYSENSQKEAIKALWNSEKDYIVEEELVFPIIKYKGY